MIQKGSILTVLACLFSFFLNSQSISSVSLENKPFYPLAKINQGLLNQLEQNPQYLASSMAEKDFIYWTNFARLYPKSFCDSILVPFLKEQPSAKGTEANQLMEELYTIKELPILLPDPILSNASKEHAKDLSFKKGIISHNSTNGNSFSQRMKKFGVLSCAAENISLGEKDQLVALILLYLDIGLPEAGHRKNLMNPSFLRMGVSVQQLKGTDQYITVQDFRCLQ